MESYACGRCDARGEAESASWTDYSLALEEDLAAALGGEGTSVADAKVLAYGCQHCALVLCETCKSEHLEWSKWSGWAKTTCCECRQPFGPGRVYLAGESVGEAFAQRAGAGWVWWFAGAACCLTFSAAALLTGDEGWLVRHSPGALRWIHERAGTWGVAGAATLLGLVLAWFGRDGYRQRRTSRSTPGAARNPRR